MRQSLQERCEAQVRCETAMRKAAKLEFEQIVKLGAMMHVNAGKEVDVERIKECRGILKEKAGIFSNFRGSFQHIVLVKMAIADDPATYFDEVMVVYDQLRSGRKLPGEMLAMAATTIVENCPTEQRVEVVEKTREAYAKLKEMHPFLTDDNDMSLIALMIMAGKDVDQAAAEAEGLFQSLKDSYRISSDVAQSVAMVLSLSDKPAEEKLQGFLGLFEACKETGHATSKDKAMTVYSAFADVDFDLAELVATIGEVDDWLKGQKGYGMLGIGASQRRLFATSIVLEDLRAGSAASAAGVAGAVTQAVVEELVLILIMIIVMSVIISMSVSSAVN